MNFSNFSLAKEDEGSYTISHPNGKSMNISKKGLSEKAHEIISKLQKPKSYAEGGGVADDAIDQFVNQDQAPAPEASEGVLTPQMQQSLANIAQPSASEVPIGATPSQSIPPAMPQVQQDPLVQQKLSTEDLLNKQQTTAQQYGKDLAAAESQKQNAFNEFNNFNKNRKTQEQLQQELQAKDDAFAQAFMKKQVDPDHYWKNKSTGSKISSAIGLLFSGIGSGMSGQENLALKQINQAIANDIDAQKNNEGKAKTVWDMNRHAMGSALAAHAATENQMYTAAQAKLMQAGAGVESANAKLKVGDMINQIEQQKVQNRTMLGLLNQGQSASNGTIKADPASLVNQFVPEAQRAKALDEIGKAQHVAKSQGQMLDYFDQAAKENTILRTGANPFGQLRTPAAMTNLQALAQPLIKDEAGRPNEIQQKIFYNLLPHPGDTDSKIAEKRNGLVQYMGNFSESPTFKAATGLDLNKFQSANTNTLQAQPKNDQYMAWAQANPQNPLAQKYLKANGG